MLARSGAFMPAEVRRHFCALLEFNDFALLIIQVIGPACI
jgi:hypothetical protein